MPTIPSLSECDPGFQPYEFNVVVAPEVVEAKTAGGIFLPDATKETEGLATMKGRLVAASPAAFDFAAEAPRAKPGDVVLYAKYGGVLVKGRDGREYRVLKDRDLIAVFDAA